MLLKLYFHLDPTTTEAKEGLHTETNINKGELEILEHAISYKSSHNQKAGRDERSDGPTKIRTIFLR
jgi:hypothetical protein